MAQIQVVKKKDMKKKRDPLKDQKNIWLAGHCLTLGFGTIFTITYLFHVLLFFKYRNWKWLFLRVNKDYHFIAGNRWYHSIVRFLPRVFYRMALVGSIISLSVTMYQNWATANPQWYEMLSSENFQMMILAALWVFVGRRSFYRLFPYMILSFIHLTNSKQEIKGTVEPGKMTKRNVFLLRLLSYSELVVLLALALDSILLKDGTSGICLTIYFAFYWLRFNFSPYAQATALDVLGHLDHHVPPKYRPQWDKVKRFIQAKDEARMRRREKIEKTI
ncbi:hypothetical protein ZYGR_0AF04270 [Zygosaccharomyces rouxii]|uniref:Uncharacterized protein n=1 Tax=Zygosaccharomyces rouxii TaxID=4956 RepID=A0A1Q3A883_ZYGRO|nr:hypothetical protein ZYGR_0AF04270 [Zygosaccharomyces rouxii]